MITCPLKRDYFNRKYIWTNHWFSGDMLVPRRVTLFRMLFRELINKKHKTKNKKNIIFGIYLGKLLFMNFSGSLGWSLLLNHHLGWPTGGNRSLWFAQSLKGGYPTVYMILLDPKFLKRQQYVPFKYHPTKLTVFFGSLKNRHVT